MKRALVLLWALGGAAWAGVHPPDTLGCREKPERATCLTDDRKKGACAMQSLNTPDFSQPGPPTFKLMDHRVCVANPAQRSVMDLVYLILGVVAVCGLVVYNLFRRRSLSDLP